MFKIELIATIQFRLIINVYDEERGDEADVPATKLQLTYRISTFLLGFQSCRSRVQKNNLFKNMTTQMYRERQLWSGNESVEIRYVSGSFVARTSASSPGFPRHM